MQVNSMQVYVGYKYTLAIKIQDRYHVKPSIKVSVNQRI